MTYIATFYHHFGAVRFQRELSKRGIQAKMMPVPRRLSSSCGTCVQFEYDGEIGLMDDTDVEQVFLQQDHGYRLVLENREDE